MSRSSYPSPVSSTASPNLDDNPGQVPRPLPEVFARDHAQTQNNLRQASAALEAAYRRIRQVRRSLLELSDTLPPSEPQTGIANVNDIGPGHEAIMLSGTSVEDPVDSDEGMDLGGLRSSLPVSTVVDGVEQIEPDFGRDGRYFDAERGWSDHISQPTQANAQDPVGTVRQPLPSHTPGSPLSPTRQNFHSRRRSWLESQLSRRREQNPNDPSTALGRRVAAREAAGGSNSVDTLTAPWLDENPSVRTSEIARDLEIMGNRFLVQFRHTDPSISATGEAPPRSTDGNRIPDANALRAASQPQMAPGSSLFPPRPPASNRRWRAMRAESRQNSGPPPNNSTQSDRLSLLSNFSVQNLATPTSNFSRDRPLLFDEPASYIQPANLAPRRSEETLETTTVGADRRSYIVRRRVNADGEEHIHNINLEWDDEDSMSRLMPARERLQQDPTLEYMLPPRPPRAPLRYDRGSNHRSDVNPVARSSAAPMPDAPSRRRGWARLDPDGNEIPSDEEEELERVRAQRRLRMLYQARAHVSAAIPMDPAEAAMHESRIAVARANARSLVPVTRTSISHVPDDDAGLTENSPRVRLNSRDPRAALSSLESIMSLDNDPRRSSPGQSELVDLEIIGSAAPFTVDPLPMPLTQMVPVMSKTRNQVGTQVIRLPKHASLAGR